MNLQTASAKGQVSIPVNIRKTLGIEPGTPIQFIERVFADGLSVFEARRLGTEVFTFGNLEKPHFRREASLLKKKMSLYINHIPPPFLSFAPSLT